MMTAIDISSVTEDAVVAALKAFMAEREPLYLVGGAVRDHLLGLSSVPGWSYRPAVPRHPARAAAASSHKPRPAATTDLDLVLPGPVLPVARRVADRLGWAYYPLDKTRDVARLVGVGAEGRRIECDAAALRGDLKADLLARDFTVNSMALEISTPGQPKLIDPYGGAADLEARTLRQTAPDSFDNDPVRLLRAARLAIQLSFTIEDSTRAQIAARAAAILAVSVERVREELWKLLDCTSPEAGVRELEALGLLAHLLPEVKALQGVIQSSPHHLDAYEHSLLTVHYAAQLRDWLRGGPPAEDGALLQALAPWSGPLRTHFAGEIAAGRDRAGWLVWHALFHDTGKAGGLPPTECHNDAGRPRRTDHYSLSAKVAHERISHLRFSRREVVLAQKVAALHGRPRRLYLALDANQSSVPSREAFRYFREAGSVAGGRQVLHGTHAGSASPPLDGVDVVLQAISDMQATGLERGEDWPRFLAALASLLESAFSQQPPHLAAPFVDGHTVMAHLGLSEGPAVGAILRQLAEAQAAGELSSATEALALAEALLAAKKSSGASGL